MYLLIDLGLQFRVVKSIGIGMKQRYTQAFELCVSMEQDELGDATILYFELSPGLVQD